MKRVMKKVFLGGFIVLLFVCEISVNVFASYKDFAGSADYSYSKVSLANVKDTTDTLMGIRWRTSDEGVHKMWFDCRSTGGTSFSKLLVDSKNSVTKYQNTRAIKGNTYYLWASREHIINPSTYVTGTWQP